MMLELTTEEALVLDMMLTRECRGSGFEELQPAFESLLKKSDDLLTANNL